MRRNNTFSHILCKIIIIFQRFIKFTEALLPYMEYLYCKNIVIQAPVDVDAIKSVMTLLLYIIDCDPKIDKLSN